MNNTGRDLFDIGYMDTLSAGDTALHRLDPRAKLVTTLAFISAVVSFDKYALSALTPFFIYPAVLISSGGLPVRYILKKVLLVAPFAVLVAMFNPFLDTGIMMRLGPVDVSGGLVSFLSIMMRFFLTASAAFILISLTGFNAVCAGLARFGVPRPLVTQLLFSYRYMFVLTDESERMLRASSLRAVRPALITAKTFVSLVGTLLLRTFGRAERIYCAMSCRGFDGRIRLARAMRIGYRDVLFTCGWIVVFAAFRFSNVPDLLGAFVMGLLP